MRAGILFVLHCAWALLPAGAVAAQPEPAKLLPEATVLDGIDGDLVRDNDDAAWAFALTADVNKPGVQMPAGTRFELLPSPMLAELTADVNDRALPRYRLSAVVTLFEGRNYLLPIYYLPLSKLHDSASATEVETRRPAAQFSGPGSAELAVPKEILEKLRERPPLRVPLRQRAQRTEATPPAPARNQMLVDTVGMIRSEADGFVFEPYGLGWQVSRERFELLPCAGLERAINRQATLLEPIRVNVVGLVTRFEGRRYLLLQRTVPVYNYGNFVR